MDFKSNWLMYLLAAGVIGFVVVESLFFLVKAWKRGKELGISKQTLVNTVTNSAIYSVAPAISILATVFVLANALGNVLPWIRLSVIGNLQYETVAATSILSELGGSLTEEVTDPAKFAAVAWGMTIGCCLPLILVPIFCKKIHKKVGDVVNKSSSASALADVVAAAAFIGIIAAFVSKSINGIEVTKTLTGENVVSSRAGFLSIATLIVSIVVYLLLDTLATKKHLTKFSNFVMPIAMFTGMGAAVLMTQLLPQSLVLWSWPWLPPVQ
ncbi:MAG: DUF5058 family protein [Clostridia bacterium]|nr:DUF5058 family protein [Clostridia bacterium]